VARFAVMADLLVATQFEACGSERLVALGVQLYGRDGD
jgi:hypothetical protein